VADPREPVYERNVRYRVAGLLVQAKRTNGVYAHIYEGGFLPADQDPEQLVQMLDEGLVVDLEAAAS
jgi:hypothetical protein